MNLRPLLNPTLAVLAVIAVPTLAQAPAGADATATAAALPAVPASNCVAPVFPGKLASSSNSRISTFNKEYKVYNECVRKYVDGNRNLVKALEEANNKVIDEYNKFTENVKKEVDAAKE